MSKSHRNNSEAGEEPRESRLCDKPMEHAPSDDDCRCKVSKGKTLPGMLKLMVKDLLFWKKERKS